MSNQAYWSSNMVMAVSGVVWLVAFLAFLVIGGWSFGGALLVSLLLAGAVFAVLMFGFREDPPEPVEAPRAESAPQVDEAMTPAAATRASAARTGHAGRLAGRAGRSPAHGWLLRPEPIVRCATAAARAGRSSRWGPSGSCW